MSKDSRVRDTEHAQEFEWLQAAQKDPNAFDPIFEKYHDAIFNYVLRRTTDVKLAEDITGSTFMKALRNLKRFRWRDISISSWLYRIATNEINQYYRKRKRIIPLSHELTSTLRDDREADDALLEIEEAVEKNKAFRQVCEILGKLKPKYQTVLTLRYFEEKSIKEIADILEISENTVKTHVRRGLIQIRNLLP